MDLNPNVAVITLFSLLKDRSEIIRLVILALIHISVTMLCTETVDNPQPVYLSEQQPDRIG